LKETRERATGILRAMEAEERENLTKRMAVQQQARFGTVRLGIAAAISLL
jgi:CHASE3 domain sensor protein